MVVGHVADNLVSSRNGRLLCLWERSPENLYIWMFTDVKNAFVTLSTSIYGGMDDISMAISRCWIETSAIGRVYCGLQGKPGSTGQHQQSFSHLANVCCSNTQVEDRMRHHRPTSKTMSGHHVYCKGVCRIWILWAAFTYEWFYSSLRPPTSSWLPIIFFLIILYIITSMFSYAAMRTVVPCSFSIYKWR